MQNIFQSFQKHYQPRQAAAVALLCQFALDLTAKKVSDDDPRATAIDNRQKENIFFFPFFAFMSIFLISPAMATGIHNVLFCSVFS
jgi:hypothetical protein